MKKLISMLLLVSMVILLLSACNSLERDEETTESSTTENTDIPTREGLVMSTYYLPYSSSLTPISLTFYEDGRYEAKYQNDSEELYWNYYNIKDGQVVLSARDARLSYVFTILQHTLVFDEEASTATLWEVYEDKEIIYYLPGITESEIIATAVMSQRGLEALPVVEKLYGKYEGVFNRVPREFYVFRMAGNATNSQWSNKILGTPYTFTYNNEEEILVFLQGRLLTLNQALARGVITLDILEELNATHHNCQIEHSYDDGVITTLSEKEVILYTCRVCNDTKTVDLPKDFAFTVTWSFDGKYNSQTGHLENGYNYQLDTKCETTLILEHRELMNIYRLLYNANFTQIEEDFFASDIDAEPSYNIKFSYLVDGKTAEFAIKGASELYYYADWELYPEFGYAHEKIVEFITNTEEYKSLPPNTNAYD